jgi:hypothetical protein
MRLVPTRANGQYAFGLYMRDGDVYRPFNMPVLTLAPDGVSHVACFFDLRLFKTFGLPESLPVSAPPGEAGSAGAAWSVSAPPGGADPAGAA